MVAFGSVPKDGGTFTFYNNLRDPLLAEYIDLRCVSVGRQEAELYDDAFADEACVLLAKNESNIKKQAQVFAQWCDNAGVDIVFGVNSIAILSALPHLPAHIRVMSRCANAFNHGYRITLSCAERLSRIVALAPKQVEELVNTYGADESRIVLIPNGTSAARFAVAARTERGAKKSLRLGFLGRLEHNQKGVLFLPGILHRLCDNDVDFSLTIAGKGVHESVLQRELEKFIAAGTVKFIGALESREIAGFFTSIDVYLFPSQFEGSPNALIEAMMAGCVPAAWKLEGITDFVIDDGTSGVLAGLGDCVTLADSITQLARNRSLVRQMSKNAVASARKQFSRDRVVSGYVALINQVMEEPPRPWQTRDWRYFRVDPAFRQSFWRCMIPTPVKKLIKKTLFKMPRPTQNE